MAFFYRQRLAQINRDRARGIATDQFERRKLAEYEAKIAKRAAKEATKRADSAERRIDNDSSSFKALDAICDALDAAGSMNLPQPVRAVQRELHNYLTIDVSERSQPDLIKRIRTMVAEYKKLQAKEEISVLILKNQQAKEPEIKQRKFRRKNTEANVGF